MPTTKTEAGKGYHIKSYYYKRDLNLKLDAITKTSMLEYGAYVREKAIPITPKGKTGNLRRSFYHAVRTKGRRIVLVIGNRASYSGYVHDRKFKNYTEPGTDWKFLERAIVQTKNKLKGIFKSKNTSIRGY